MKRNLSYYTMLILGIILAVYRMNTVSDKETSWDVLGYYLYLPASFVHHDPLLKDVTWLKEVNAEKQLTGTLYQLSANDKGEPMYFFLYGWSLLFLPFFLLGHLFAAMGGHPTDGFSYPYQFALVVGGVIYTLIGLYFLRKVLITFFTEHITSITLAIIVLGTNYINHLTIKNLEPVNVLFMLMTVVVWNSMRWNESKDSRYFRYSVLAVVMMALVKPSEVIAMMIPLLWGITSWKGLMTRIAGIFFDRRNLIITAGLALLLALPQMIYWTLKTGFPLYDSYKNAGVGLDFFSPHFIDVLFSYRKGWLLYTPLMIFSLWGFYFLWKKNRHVFAAITMYFLLSFYIISSWTEWWYGAAFSCRPLITTYPLLAISFGYFFNYLGQQKKISQIGFAIIILAMIFLNQFQWWQLKNYILDPYRTTKSYYWATFLKTSVSAEDRDLLMFERPFTSNVKFDNKEKYDRRDLELWTFENASEKEILKDSSGNHYYHLSPEIEYSRGFEYRYKDLTEKDHVWLKATVDIRYPAGFTGELPCLVMCMEHLYKSYGYLAPELKPDSAGSHWQRFTVEYLSPQLRNTKDLFKCYIWNRGKGSFDVDNFGVEVFEPKN